MAREPTSHKCRVHLAALMTRAITCRPYRKQLLNLAVTGKLFYKKCVISKPLTTALERGVVLPKPLARADTGRWFCGKGTLLLSEGVGARGAGRPRGYCNLCPLGRQTWTSHRCVPDGGAPPAKRHTQLRRHSAQHAGKPAFTAR